METPNGTAGSPLNPGAMWELDLLARLDAVTNPDDEHGLILEALCRALGAAHASLWDTDPGRAGRLPLLLAASESRNRLDGLRQVLGPLRRHNDEPIGSPVDLLERAALASGCRAPYAVPVGGLGHGLAHLLVADPPRDGFPAVAADTLAAAGRILGRTVYAAGAAARDRVMDEILRGLHVLYRDMRTAPGLDEFSRSLAGVLTAALQAAEIAVLVADDTADVLQGVVTCDAASGRRRFRPELPRVTAGNCAILRRALSGRGTILTRAEASAENGLLQGFVDVSGGGELAVIPVSDGTRTSGVLLARSAAETSILSRLRPERVVAVGQRVGMMLENVRVREKHEQSLRNVDELLRLSSEVSSTLDSKDVPEVVARRARDLCEADDAILFLLEPDAETLRPVIVLGSYEEEVMKIRPKVGTGITGMVARSRTAEIVNHAETDPRSAHVPGTPVEPEAILAVPLVSADELVGVLSLYKLEGRVFRAEDLNVINIFSTQAAVAIENARLFSRVQEERTRLLTMVQHMQEAVVFGDRDGRVLLLNAAARRMLGRRAEEPDIPVLEILDGPAFQGVRDALHEVRLGKSPNVTVQAEIGGRTCLASVSSVPGDAVDRRLGEVLLFQDLSDYKRIEAQLLESNKMSAIGQLAGGVAHEFNNLIAGIYGYAQLLKMNPEGAMVDRGVDVILKSSERAQELTNSLLTFSRRRPGRRERVSLNRIVQSTLLLVGREMEKQRIRVECEIPELPTILADPAELQQVFVNILINARQALPEGGTVRIAGRALPGMVEITVEDSGGGIPAENLPRVFEPFFTTKGALAGNSTPGSGLGLTTAYNVVQDHGGTITAGNTPAGGAVFTVQLPLAERASLAATVTGPRTSAALAPRVVVVHPEGEDRDRLTGILAGLGYEVVAPTERAALVEVLREGRPDLAIVQGLPSAGDGSLYALVRQHGPHLPIVFVAPRDDDDDYPGLADAWAFLLRAPYRDRDLASLAARILARRLAAAS